MPIIPFKSDKHTKIRQKVLDCFFASERSLNDRRKKWDEADKLFRMFQTETEADKSRKSARDSGSPQYTTIEIPLSYAVLLTAHTFWSSVFLGRDPIFQYKGRHGEAQDKVQAVEALVDYQVRMARMTPVLFNWLLDTGKYGLGIVSKYWTKDIVRTRVRVEETPSLADQPVADNTSVRFEPRNKTIYEGNKLFSVRPHDFFPDPTVSLPEYQNGQFYGRLTQVSWNSILKRDDYFNKDEVKETMGGGSDLQREGSKILDLPEEITSKQSFSIIRGKNSQVVQLFELTVELIPKEFELEDSDFPEKWVITLANGQVIIGATPLAKDNDQYPFFLNTYEIDPYSFMGRGMMEVLKPLNDTAGWLLNTHFFNVRKSLNNQLVVDPLKVYMKDVERGGAGGAIRIRPSAYGTDIKQIVHQLPVQDITRANLSDLSVVSELMELIAGVNRNMQGVVNEGGQKTATEIRTSTILGTNRQKTFAEYNSALGWAPLSQDILQESQAHYEGERKFRIAGELGEDAIDPFIDVTREAISGFYDYVPVDGTFPIDRFAQAEIFQQLIVGLARVPELLQQFDISKMVGFTAKLMGIKNLGGFKVVPDQALADQEQAGNAIPLPQPNGGLGAPG